MRVLVLRSFAVLLGLIGLAYVLPGIYLISLGGSYYYFCAGLLFTACSWVLFKKREIGLSLFGTLVVLTLIWTVYEKGLSFWPLLPRLALPSLLGLVLLSPALRNILAPNSKTPFRFLASSLLLSFLFTVSGYAHYISGLSIDPQVFEDLTRRSENNASTRTDWLAYGNSRHGTRYSPADQINRENVAQLELAWTFRTGIGYTFKNTPLQIDNRIYVCGAGNVVIALDAETGEEQWRFDAEVNDIIYKFARYFSTTCRGVSYYSAPESYTGECPTRLLLGTTDARLLAIDAETGKTCANFGDGGTIDLTYKMGEVKPLYYFVTSAPAIVRGNAVVGGWVLDNQETNEPSGVIRAFDALTGEFSWAWDMGRPGTTKEPEAGEIYTRATPNMWSIFSVDEQRGIVYAPIGNETPDYFGGHRLPSTEKYASAVVAINGDSGELLWSFQTVHHDIWDYDVPSQPALIDIPDENGNLVPALAQATKRGEIFLLNRVTGEPIAEVEERAVPQGGVPEDWTAPTQPYSALPNVIREGLQEEDMWGLTPFDQMWCRINFRKMRYEGNFTPPSTVPGFQYPGNAGGYNWGSLSIDEAQHILVGNILRVGNKTLLIPRAEMKEGNRVSPQLGTPYGMSTRRFVSPLGIPCNEPPYGMLVAIDLQSQELLWSRPIGTANEMIGVDIEFGTPAITGGTISTAGGLLFFAATRDNHLRALDIRTGKELWRYNLPNSGQGTPMTYVSPVSQQQFVVLAVPEAPNGDGLGGYLMAFHLPDDTK